MVKVLSLGGSIIAPDKVDTDFLKAFYDAIKVFLNEDTKNKIIIITGGGAPARYYQRAYRDIATTPQPDRQDWIGIAATRLNGELLKSIFQDYCVEPVVTDPSAVEEFSGQVLIAAGWKPGFSTDFDAVVLAERFGADTIVNLSNIAKVYTDDPQKNPDARPLDSLGWKEFRKMVGDQWIPGKNSPFDPVASQKAADLRLRVITAHGRNIDNLKRVLAGKPFEGTTIGPE